MTRKEAIDILISTNIWNDEEMTAWKVLVPELTESEDERMLREIKRYIKEQGDKPTGLPNGTVAVSDMIAWLEKQKETIHISENGMLAWLKKQEEEEGYEAIPVESTLEYKLGFKAGKESEKQKNLTTENIYKHSKERMSFYNGQKKEQKPVSNPKWAELTWKDINELERIINNVHYEFQNGIGEDSFGELVLERFKEYKDDGSMDEQKPAECERQPEFKEVEYDFRGEKVKVMRPFFRDDKGREFSTTGQDTDLTWSVLREWCEIKGITPYDLYPRAEWSEEDEEMLDIVLTMVDCSTVVPHSGGQLHPSESYKKDISDWLKSLCPQSKQEWSEDDERRRDGIIQWLREYQKEFNPKYDSLSIESIESLIDWLKFLRPQYHGDVTMTEAYKMGLEAGKASSWKPSEKQTNNVIVELTRIELGDIINGLYYLKEKYYEDCKEHNGTATIGLSDEFKFYFKRFNEALDLYTRLHELEKEKYGTTTDGYYYE